MLAKTAVLFHCSCRPVGNVIVPEFKELKFDASVRFPPLTLIRPELLKLVFVVVIVPKPLTIPELAKEVDPLAESVPPASSIVPVLLSCCVPNVSVRPLATRIVPTLLSAAVSVRLALNVASPPGFVGDVAAVRAAVVDERCRD